MNVLANNMVKGEVGTFAFPFKPLPYNNIVTVSALSPNSVSKITNVVNFPRARREYARSFRVFEVLISFTLIPLYRYTTIW